MCITLLQSRFSAVAPLIVTLSAMFAPASTFYILVGFTWYLCGWSNYTSFRLWHWQCRIIWSFYELSEEPQHQAIIFFNLIHVSLHMRRYQHDQRLAPGHSSRWCVNEYLRLGEGVYIPYYQWIHIPCLIMSTKTSPTRFNNGVFTPFLYSSCSASISMSSTSSVNTGALLSEIDIFYVLVQRSKPAPPRWLQTLESYIPSLGLVLVQAQDFHPQCRFPPISRCWQHRRRGP